MRESNTLAGDAIIKQLPNHLLQNIKEQYMRESNTFAGIVENN